VNSQTVRPKQWELESIATGFLLLNPRMNNNAREVPYLPIYGDRMPKAKKRKQKGGPYSGRRGVRKTR